MRTSDLVFAVLEAKATADTGDLGLVTDGHEEVEVDLVDGAYVARPAGLMDEPTPLTVRVRELLGRI